MIFLRRPGHHEAFMQSDISELNKLAVLNCARLLPYHALQILEGPVTRYRQSRRLSLSSSMRYKRKNVGWLKIFIPVRSNLLKLPERDQARYDILPLLNRSKQYVNT